MLASSRHRGIEPPSRQSIEPHASNLHRACIEPASSHSIEPAYGQWVDTIIWDTIIYEVFYRSSICDAV